MAYRDFLYFFCFTLALKPRELKNPFPDIYKFSFDSGDVIFILVTSLDLYVFPNIAMTTIFHVHSRENVFLTWELSLPERLLSGETMIY